MSQERRNRPGQASEAVPNSKLTTTSYPDSTPNSVQIAPIGPPPNFDTCFVGSLLYNPPAAAARTLALVDDDDIDNPATALVLSAVRALLEAGKPHGPQLVLDELRRTGKLNQLAAEKLRTATTSGANQGASHHYAAAVVADSLRRRVEGAGIALTESAFAAAEDSLLPLIDELAESIRNCVIRLQQLRGITS